MNDNTLVLIKKVDKTQDVESYVVNGDKTTVTFNSGSSFDYNTVNVAVFECPENKDLSKVMALKNNVALSVVEKIQVFQDHTRILYKSGYREVVENATIKFVNSCLENQKANDIFTYLKEVASLEIIDDKTQTSSLGKKYNAVDFVRDDSMLAYYLKGELPESAQPYKNLIIYPFGFNLSQKSAVEKALNNDFSIIEGPPGTGKTQTILNIIANIVVSEKNVAVVSANNSATANILEKLQKNGLGFIAAYLGNEENKKAFIERQSGVPDISGWRLETQKVNEYMKALETLNKSLEQSLQWQNQISALEQKLELLLVEMEHYKESGIGAEVNTGVLKSSFIMTPYVYTQMWAQCEHYQKIAHKTRLRTKIGNFLFYGVYSWKFYRLPFETQIFICQKSYYASKEDELRTKIKKIKAQLGERSFKEKMDLYSQYSMQLFKSALCKRYAKKTRPMYSVNDLWQKSEDFVKDYPVVLSTTFSLSSSLSKTQAYDYVIADESSQVSLTTGALSLSCGKRAVVVGDLKQLPNVVSRDIEKSSEEVFCKYNIPEAYRYYNHSLLSSMAEIFPNAARTLLKEHYRCQSKIIEFCNQKYYNNELIVLTKPKSERAPLVVYKTNKGNHERDHVNQRQIDVIKADVFPQQNLDACNGSIGIICPYRNQTAALQAAFKNTCVQAATVNGFQGQERDVIILSTVDNEISEFADNPNRLNVAVSRAAEQLILVVSDNEEKRETEIGDLIDYVRYNNFEVIESKVYSVFDMLYSDYAARRIEFLRGKNLVSEYDSENLMHSVITKVLQDSELAKYDVAAHIPLKMIVRDTTPLSAEEIKYLQNYQTHVDFLIFNKLGRKPVLAVEVDGYAFHNENTPQAKRDALKNHIFMQCGIDYMRFGTTESGEEQRLLDRLKQLTKSKNSDKI